MHRTLLLLATLLTAQPGAAGAAYTQLFAFGDSLSDNGNAYILSEGAWPLPPSYAERFSNGPVAAEILAAELGIDLAPSAAGGTGYAVGGATTGSSNFNYDWQTPYALPASLGNTGVRTQVDSFLASGTRFDPTASLFLVWAAPNDFFDALVEGGDLFATATHAVLNLLGAVATLASQGATNVLVPNMPDLSLTPLGLMQSAVDREVLAALSLGFNAALGFALEQFELAMVAVQPDFNLTTFDTAALLTEVTAAPSAFGFTNVTEPCLASNGALQAVQDGCQGYLYMDEVHPTTAAHALLADRFISVLEADLPPGAVPLRISQRQVPEPPPWILLAAALGALQLVYRRTQPGVLKR